ncbi:MAG: HlyD family efflux transporter periplasmic adaptor subunit [Lewinellaceae bacterium]|nr:HlyD family efflux transporter periplasmic adaptor subunit [Lewinellaceae bacterium]
MPSTNGIDMAAARRPSEIQELLGDPPGWLLQSGVTILSLVTGAVLLASWFIRYPDKLVAEALIQSEFPPVELRIPAAGRIDTIAQADKAVLAAGALVAILEGAANGKDMLLLDSLLGQAGQWSDIGALASRALPHGLELGPLQGAYAVLEQTLADIQYFLRQTEYADKAAALGREAEAVQLLVEAYHGQQAFFLREKELVEKDYSRNHWLFTQGVASQLELEQSESMLWQYEQKMKNLEVSGLQSTIRLRQLEAQAVEARHEYENRQQGLWLAWRQAVQNTRGALEEWKKQNLVTAPVSGRLELAPEAKSHAAVQAGQLLGTVLPTERGGATYAYLRLPPAGIGKVEIGAPVKISLAAYPSMEYGQVHAVASDITLSPQPGENGPAYYLKALLPDTLRTNYGYAIALRPNMPATAEVITKDRRILERIAEKFLDVLNN